MVGHSNKAPVVIDGQEATALIDLGAQVLSISTQFCEGLTLPIQPLGWLLELEGTGGAAIPYLGFVEVNLPDSRDQKLHQGCAAVGYPHHDLLQDGTTRGGFKIIDKALSLMTVGELAEATMAWRQAHFGAVILWSLQLFCSSSGESEMREGANCSP